MADDQSSNSGDNQIRELQTGRKGLDIKSKMRKVSNWITKNNFLVEFDFFHTEIKFLVNGDDSYGSKFGGFISLVLLVLAFLMTYNISWPSELTSQITIKQLTKDSEKNDYDLCTHTRYPVQFNISKVNPQSYPNEQIILPAQAQIFAYLNSSDGTKYSIPMSSACPPGIFMCIDCQSFEGVYTGIYGGPSHKNPEANITFEFFWCNQTDPQCLPLNLHTIYVTFTNMIQQRQMQMYSYEQKIKILPDVGFINNCKETQIYITRQNYESNSKFFGHLSNLNPWSTQSYLMTGDTKSVKRYFDDENYTQFTPIEQKQHMRYSFVLTSSGRFQQFKEEFEDVGLSLVFFFAILDPLVLLGVFFIIKWYNNNAKDLFIANKLFYVEDPANDEKYDFDSGITVILICMFYRHPLMKLFEFFIKLCGYNLTDVLSNKALETIAMINQGSMLLRQEEFFNLLQSLASIDNTQPKKVELIANSTKEEEDQLEENYFPYDSIKREAFRKFCEDNQFCSGRRKNRFYHLLLDKKYSKQLKSVVHKIFTTYVRNVTNLKNKGKFLETIHDQEIPVDISAHKKEQQVVDNIEQNSQVRLSKLRSSKGPIL